MKMTQGRAAFLKANVLFLVGTAWGIYFAFWHPERLDKYWVFLIGLCWFGPGFVVLIRSKALDDESKKN